MVDGYFTNGSCYFSGAVNPTDLYTNRTNQTNYVAGAGTHVVQTYVYTTAPLTWATIRTTTTSTNKPVERGVHCT